MGHVRRLIVFDLDGTLIDSRQDLVDSANALIAEREGVPLPGADISRMVGEGAAALVRRALTAAGLTADDAAIVRFLQIYDERLLLHTRPYPGVLQVLQELAREPDTSLALLTNKPRKPAQVLIEALGLQPFLPVAIGGDGPFPRKPDPESLRHLISVHDALPRTTVLVGDSKIDFETARSAGTHVCLARYGFGYERFPIAELCGTEGLVDVAAEIPGTVRRLIDGAEAASWLAEPPSAS